MAKKHDNKPTDSRYVKGSRYYGEAGYINYRDWTSPYANKPTDSRYVKGSRYYGEAGYINYRDWTSPYANKPTDSRYIKGYRYYGEAGYINYRDWTSPYQPTSTPSRNDMRYGESLYRDGATQADIIAEEQGIRAMIDQIERKHRGIGI